MKTKQRESTQYKGMEIFDTVASLFLSLPP